MSLTKYLHQVKPRDESYVNHVDRIQGLFITETVGARGLAYERDVHAALKAAKVPDLFAGPKPAAYSNQGEGDIEATYKNEKFNIEVKLNKNAQMGGTSIRIDADNDTYVLVTPDAVDDDAIPFFMETAKLQEKAVKDYMAFVRKQEPLEFHKDKANVVPFGSITKSAWVAAQQAGLLKQLNAVISFEDAKNIAKIYNRKNVYYIEIGKAGLFYLGSNPLKLNVPEFRGSVNIEFRLRPSGSRNRKIGDETIRVVSATYSCIGRLKTKIKSPYSLSKIEDIETLFGVR